MKLHSEIYESYKKSEGEWSETIPSEWQEKRVKDLFRLVTDAAPANNDYELLSLYAGIGVKPRKDMDARGNKASSTDGYWIVKKNDIVVNKLLAWMGSVGLSEYDGVTSPAYDVLRKVKPNIDPRYFSYLFRTETAKKIFRKNSRGIMDMRLRLYFDKLGAITVPVPPYEEQQAIANYIENRVTKIEKKVSILQEYVNSLLQLKKAYIHRLINQGGADSSALKDFGDIWVEKHPKHWKVRRIKELATIVNGATPKSGKIEYWDGDLAWVTTDDLGKVTGRYIRNSKRKLTELGYSSCGSTICPKGSVVISGRAPIGHLAILDIGAGTNQGCKTLVIDSKKCTSLFLYYSLLSSRQKLEAHGRGTTFIELSSKELALFKIPLPDIDEQVEVTSQIEAGVESIEGKIELVKTILSKYQNLKISIISDSVLGSIKVSKKYQEKGVAV